MNLYDYGDGGLLAPCYERFYHSINERVYFRNILKGGRSSAKGDTAYTIMILTLLSSNVPSEARVYVPVSKNIRKGVYEQVQKVAKRIGINYHTNLSTLTIKLSNGSRIIFEGLDATKKDVNEDLSKGATTSLAGGIRIVVFDELGALSNFSRVESIIDTFTRGENGDLQIIEISNPAKNKTSAINQRYLEMEERSDTFVMHTTIFDIPRHWLTEQQIANIKEMYQNESLRDRFNHAIMGLITGDEGLAFNVTDLLVDKIPLVPNKISVYTDHGDIHATSFLLFGEITQMKQTYLLDTWYHSNVNDKEVLAPSQYTQKFLEFYQKHKFSKDTTIICDNIGFVNELRLHGFNEAKYIGDETRKNRALYYHLTDKAIRSNFFKILNTPNNFIAHQQLSNAETEEIIVGGRSKIVVKKRESRDVPEEKQLNAADCIFYYWQLNGVRFGIHEEI